MLEDQTAPAPSRSKPGVVHVQRMPGDAVLCSSMLRPSVLGGVFAKRSIFERDESGNDTLMGEDTAPIMTFGKKGLGERFEQTDHSVLSSAPDIRSCFPLVSLSLIR